MKPDARSSGDQLTPTSALPAGFERCLVRVSIVDRPGISEAASHMYERCLGRPFHQWLEDWIRLGSPSMGAQQEYHILSHHTACFMTWPCSCHKMRPGCNATTLAPADEAPADKQP